MTIEKHDLVHEFPELRDKIHELKTTNAHFARLFEEYHDADREVRRMEEEIETPSDDVVEQAKMKRVHLKDQLYAMLTQ
ncbi:DUF465 domain-containing protein [Sinimarinibacterium sp. CAU 1509]|uniref:YdcH family protein n=1 Tax=Sinimarinibacterium sp. CAU 1509 TaxID=2562283 RepID=UPI0010AC1C6F|nr:DUF465 domain-containing protein [Sinimarinibacterium sp. CAU 1509]TJY64978.1 DUF465 domain-containing protein [Sinimarinibacterium sp. CAU 1509]